MILPAQRTILRTLPTQLHPMLHPSLSRATSRVSPTIKFLSAFTTHTVYSDRKVPASRPGPETQSTGPSRDGTVGSRSRPGSVGFDTELPAVSLESLGIGRNMKVFLLVVLGIFGSLETWFWCKAIWIWWNRKDDVEDGGR